MAVKIIRENQGAEVTDKMLHAVYEARNNFVYAGDPKKWDSQVAEAMRTAFEDARETEIERIEIRSDKGDDVNIEQFGTSIKFRNKRDDADMFFDHEDLISLAEALLEVGRQIT